MECPLGQGLQVTPAILTKIRPNDLGRPTPCASWDARALDNHFDGMASPESVALAIFEAVGNREEEIFPDPASAPMAAHWRDGAAKLPERQLAQAAPVSS